MGGGSEVDRASSIFVDAAGGGDVLVLRASGSIDSYTSYFSAELPLTTPPRAVATARIDVDSAGSDAALLCRVARADAIWLAGGDQGDYLLRWPDALHAALRDAIARGVAVGGTSAGAMSLSQFAYDARDGGASSAEALANPSAYSVLPSPFPAVPGVVVDTHFEQRDREGRLLAFVAKANEAAGGVLGLGLDEGTALVIDGDRAQVFADDGGRARFYRANATTVTPGAPLQLTGVAVAFADAATTTLPPVFEGEAQVAIVVEDGVVIAGATP
jgi:cyanophycinase